MGAWDVRPLRGAGALGCLLCSDHEPSRGRRSALVTICFNWPFGIIHQPSYENVDLATHNRDSTSAVRFLLHDLTELTISCTLPRWQILLSDLLFLKVNALHQLSILDHVAQSLVSPSSSQLNDVARVCGRWGAVSSSGRHLCIATTPVRDNSMMPYGSHNSVKRCNLEGTPGKPEESHVNTKHS